MQLVDGSGAPTRRPYAPLSSGPRLASLRCCAVAAAVRLGINRRLMFNHRRFAVEGELLPQTARSCVDDVGKGKHAVRQRAECAEQTGYRSHRIVSNGRLFQARVDASSLSVVLSQADFDAAGNAHIGSVGIFTNCRLCGS
jgi:hypothetical protein